MDNTRDSEGATQPFDAVLARAKREDAGNWQTILERQSPEQRRLDRLVGQVKTQLLTRPIPVATAAELGAWADERARNIVAGIQDDLRELAS